MVFFNCIVCDFFFDGGLCEVYMFKYFYNIIFKECEEFIYGGCWGNDNCFGSIDDCEKECKGWNFYCFLNENFVIFIDE